MRSQVNTQGRGFIGLRESLRNPLSCRFKPAILRVITSHLAGFKPAAIPTPPLLSFFGVLRYLEGEGGRS